MILVRSFDRAYRYALVEPSSGRLTYVSAVAGLWWAARQRPWSGWYGKLNDTVLALGLSDEGLRLWIDQRTTVPPQGVSANVRREDEVAVLEIRRDELTLASIRYRPASASMIQRFDPTNDESQEDIDFGVWLTKTLGNKERLAHLESAFA